MGEIPRYFFGSCILLGGLLWLAPVSAAKPDAEEFVVPLQAAATATTPPQRGAGRARAVKDATTGEIALRAKTARDAIAAAIGQRAAGCRLIGFGDAGFGWVATGVANYAATDNPVAVRRTRREARFKAFAEARTRLSGCLRALSPETRRRITENLEQNDAIRLALINLATNDRERWEQALKILARGFVAYAVEDDRAGHAIRVHLVATPKTAIRLTRPTASAMEAASLREGLKQIQAEVGGRLIPPAGNRLIVVNATGELALVGYAVNLIGVHPDPAAQDKLRTDAQKIATGRATEALMGLAAGDDAGWQGGLDETSRDEIEADASGYEDFEPSANRFGQIRDLLLNMVKNDRGLQALREGQLPSSATVKRFGDEDTVAVMVSYTPPVKKREPPPPIRPAAPSPVATAHAGPGMPCRQPTARRTRAGPDNRAGQPTARRTGPGPDNRAGQSTARRTGAGPDGAGQPTARRTGCGPDRSSQPTAHRTAAVPTAPASPPPAEPAAAPTTAPASPPPAEPAPTPTR